MKLFKLLDGVDYTTLQGSDVQVNNIVIDSRQVNAGDVFICIEGLKVDSHEFIDDAIKAGAAAIVVCKDITFKDNVTVVKVPNTRAAMSIMAGNLNGWPGKSFPLIGITGTNGKTSSAYFLEAILKEAGLNVGIIGTVATKVGDTPIKTEFVTSTTPDPLHLQQIFGEMKEAKAECAVMEVSSHALEFRKMEGHSFAVSMFTNLTRDHLDLHGTMENYARAKARLFELSDISIINIDDEYGQFMASYASGKVVSYSANSPSDLQALDVVCTNEGVSFSIQLDKLVKFEIPIPGRFTVYNAIGVIGMALALNISPVTIQSALRELKGVPGRIQSIDNDKGIGVYVDYSHTPDSLENILKSVREFTSGKVIVVFGCGGDRDRTKRPIMGEIAARLADFSVITSDNPRGEDPAIILDEIETGIGFINSGYIKLVDRKEAINHAISMAAAGDSVIIAGKGHENYQIFADKTITFDDAAEAAQALKRGHYD